MKLCFFALQLNCCQIFCMMYSLVLVYILNSLFLLFISFTLILSLKFSIVLPYKALLNNLCNAFFPFFSASILFCMLNSIYSFNHCNSLNSSTRCIFLVLMLVLTKVASFHNEAHTFLYQKS